MGGHVQLEFLAEGLHRLCRQPFAALAEGLLASQDLEPGDPSAYVNDTGTGNTINADSPCNQGYTRSGANAAPAR